MYLYRISQTKVGGFDTFSDAVVCAQSEDAARDIHPAGNWLPDFILILWGEDYEPDEDDVRYDWVQRTELDLVQVEYLGVADSSIAPGRVVCASYHAG